MNAIDFGDSLHLHCHHYFILRKIVPHVRIPRLCGVCKIDAKNWQIEQYT